MSVCYKQEHEMKSFHLLYDGGQSGTLSVCYKREHEIKSVHLLYDSGNSGIFSNVLHNSYVT